MAEEIENEQVKSPSEAANIRTGSKGLFVLLFFIFGKPQDT